MNLALQAGQMGLWEWDLDTGEFHFDERWADMLGERAGDLLSDASIVLSRIHRDDQEVFEQAVQAHIDGRTPEVSLQIRLRHAEGVWRWFRVYGKSNSTMNDRGGKRLVGIQMDVHEQVSAQRELARREEMLANTARMTGIGAWEVDLTTMELFWSDAVRDIHEVDRSYVPNVEEGINFYDPQDRARVSEAVRRGVEFGEPFDIECRLITAKGNKRWVRSVGEPVYQDGRIIALTGAFQDITEDRAQRLAIEESNRALEAAQAISRMGSWSFDIRSGTTRWSKHLFEIFERDAAEGAPDLQAVLAGYTPESSKRLEEAVQRAIDDAESYALTLERTNATNGVRYVAVDGRVGTDKAGRVTGIYGTARDVTAEVENETALREARLQAEDANRSKTEFLANMSHEIRTPMTAILGFADLLEDPDLDEAQRADHVTTIKRNGEHLLTIINDILDISKIEAGRMVIETIETLPDGVVRGVAGSLRVATEARGLRMSLSCKTRIPRTVRTDPTRLRQILLNLLGNAVKFTETGGVKVELSYDPCETGGVLRYEVTDTGIGMTPQQVEKCFEAFNQADASVTRRFGGTGLGLRISQRLAEALGGDLTVSSEEGRGSTFTLTVRAEAAGEQWIGPGPIALTVPEPRQTPRQSEGGDLANLHVLLLEDGQDNLRLISTHLRASGAKVTTARTGLQGLERLALDAEGRSSRAAPFDVILTDMQMPEMDGYEFVRNVRGNGCTLPIIALTAHAMADDEQRCLDVGCDAYAAKPITRRQLIDVIRESIKLRPAA